MYKALFIIAFLLSLALFYLGTGRNRHILFYILSWAAITGILAYVGFFEDTTARPPRFALVLLGAMTLCFILIRSLRNQNMNRYCLISVHLVRIPVELVLYQQYLVGKVPKLMTFTGWNFDILIGVSALFILLVKVVIGKDPGRYFMWVWNGVGILFLTAIVAMGILSSPMPFQLLAFDRPNVAVLEFPYVWLPSVIVPLVFLAHWFAIKKRKKVLL